MLCLEAKAKYDCHQTSRRGKRLVQSHAKTKPGRQKNSKRARIKHKNYKKMFIYVSQGHLGCPQFYGYPFHLLWPWLAVLDQRFGIWWKNCASYIVCQRKSFCLRIVKFWTDHYKTHTNRGKNRRLLARTARMKILVNHQPMELWNMTKKSCC